MKQKLYIFLLFLSGFTISCNAQKISIKSFYPCSNVMDLNGTYLNKNKKLSRLFSINSDMLYFITFEFNGKDSLKLTYETEYGLQNSFYKGKFKNNYFEIYFSKKLIPIPCFFLKDVNKIRIGYDKNLDLLIQHYDEHFGWIVFFTAGGEENNEYSFKNICNFKELKPSIFNGKWGFTDSLQNIVIKPQYDFVEFFKDNISRVKQNGKWGLINKKGIELTPIKYDTIYFKNSDEMVKVRLGGKEGVLSVDGTEIIPPIYDYIYEDVYSESKNLIKILLNGKKGYLNANGEEIISPVYDDIYYIASNFIKIMLNGKKGYLDKEGNVLIPPIYDTLGNITDSISVVVCSENGKYGYRTITDIICPLIFDNASDEFTTNLSDVCIYAKHNEIPYARVIYKNEPYLVDMDGYIYKYKCLKTIRKELKIFEESKIKVTELENKLSN